MERRRKLIAYGRHQGMVDAGPAREHVNALRMAGWTVREIATASGTAIQTVNRVSLGWGDKIVAVSARKLLRVQADSPRVAPIPRQRVPATGTVRRLQALVYMGYSGAELMRLIGAHPQYFTTLMREQTVFEGTRANVTAVYARLWDQPPVPRDHAHAAWITRAKRYARAQGWVGPLSWDDIDTDPAPDTDVTTETVVDDVAVHRALTGELVSLTPAENREAVRVGHERRWSDELIAARIRIHVDHVARIRKTLGLDAWPMSEQQGRNAA